MRGYTKWGKGVFTERINIIAGNFWGADIVKLKL